MKKLLSLLMAVLLVVTVMGAVPTALAEETEYTPVDSEFEYDHWGSMYSSEIAKVGNWYYRFFVSSDGEKRVSDVCGYDGNETEITIPTELDGTPITRIYRFCLFSTTVKTIKIPMGIVGFESAFDRYEQHSYGACVGIKCEGNTQLEEIIVQNGHSDFWSENGILYEGYSLLFYPPAKKDAEYVIPKEISEIESGAIWNQNYLKSLTITQDVSLIHEDAITPKLENLYFHTEQDIIWNTNDYVGTGLFGGNVFVPSAQNGTIHCIEGSAMHTFYSKPANERFYKKLEVLYDELVKKYDGKWYHFRGGVIDVRREYTYVGNDLVKYKDKWFYTEKGIWTKKTRLFEYNGKWFYIKNGKWDKTANDLVWYKNKWFYVDNGKWDSNTATLFKKNGKWFAIKSGKWYKDKAIIKYSGKKFFVNKGFVQFDYSGNVKVDGKTYKIKNGKVA